MPDNIGKLVKLIRKEIQAEALRNRSSGMAQSSIENGALPEFDANGFLMSQVGEQYDGTHAPTTYGGPVPPVPAGVSVQAGPSSIKVAWDGSFADALVPPLDWSAFEVHASPDSDFILDPLPDSTTRVGIIGQAAGGSLTFQPATGAVYIRCLTRAASGKFSDPTDAVDAYAVPPTSSVNEGGDASFTTVSSQGDITVGGVPLMGGMLSADPTAPLGLLENQAWGVLGSWNFQNVNGISATTGSGQALILGQIDVQLQPGRTYTLTMPWRATVAPSGSPAQCYVSCLAYLSYTVDGSEPPTPDGSMMIADDSALVPAATGGATNGLLSAIVPMPPPQGSAPGQIFRAKIAIAISSGVGTQATPSTYGSNPWILSISDVGPAQPVLNAAEPGAGSAQKYVTVWEANDSRSWSQNGTVYQPGGSTTDYIRQGLVGGAEWFGCFSAGGNADAGTSTELTKTIAQALTGAVLLKAEVWLWITYSEESTGQVELRPLGRNSVPSTMSRPAASSNIVKNDFPARNTGAWIEVPTSWFSATNNGCIIASPDWLFPNTNAQFAGSSYSKDGVTRPRPKVKLTYTR